MNKKSQQAVEFLVTYGWVFIIIGIAVGAIIYLGVTDPGRFMSTYCDFSSSLKCTDYALADEGTIPGTAGFLIKLQNNYGKPIGIYNISGIDVSIESCSVDESHPAELFLGETKALWCNVNDVFPAHSKRKVTIVVEWGRNETGAPRHYQIGTIYSDVCDGQIDDTTFSVTGC